MPAAPVSYAAMTEGTVAYASAGTAKTILGVTAGANSTIKVNNIKISTTGKTSTDDHILIEVLKQSTSSPSAGTSTSVTPRHIGGNSGYTTTATAGKNYTAEPSTLVIADEFVLDPTKMTGWFDLPLGRELESNVGTGIFIRVTVPSSGTVSGAVRARIEYEH